MNIGVRKWGTLIILSIIWGSSYILIKKGLTGLTPVQLGSLRMIITAILIVPFSINKLKNIPKDKIKWVVFSAFIGTFFPNYLFAFAETEISSAIAGVMVSLTPLFTLIISVLFFKEEFLKKQFLGKIKTDLKKITDVSKVSSVIKTIDRNLNNEDDWKFFEEAFNNADKEFLQKIKNSHPNLTNNDLKLCAYLRLNLSSKDIAPLLNISLRSVEIKRYRLRKKMNLTHNEGLTDYILSL